MTSSLFISYASDDQPVALEVCALLEAQGVRCWIAPRDVAPGTKWDEALLRAIDEAGAFLLLLSRASNDSPFVQNEVNRAFGKKKAIFTFRIEEVEPSGSLEFYLARHHWADGFKGPLEHAVARLSAAVGALPAIGQTPVGGSVATAPRSSTKTWARARWWRRAAAVCALAVASAAAGATGVWYTADSAVPPVTRFEIGPAGTAAPVITGIERDLALTPDGRTLVYVGDAGGTLFVRRLDALDAIPLARGAIRGPFMSPDGQWAGFVDGLGTLRRVALSGGPVVPITDMDAASRGATVLPDGTVVFATGNLATGLQRVSIDGGLITVLTRPDPSGGELDHVWPEALPDGRAVLYTVMTTEGGTNSHVALLDLATGESRVIVRGGSHARYVAPGYLVYGTATSLQAVAFDLRAGEVRGTPRTVVADVGTNDVGAVNVALATDGRTLAYMSGAGLAANLLARRLVWVERDGRETRISTAPRAFSTLSMSPDGSRVAVYAADQQRDLWLHDVTRDTITRATFDPAFDFDPVWSLDGRRLFFASQRTGVANLYVQPADGTGTAERLTESENAQWPTAISPDGRMLLFRENTPATGDDLMALALDGSRKVTPLIRTSFSERNAVVSPDGRWLAYDANESGAREVYVRPWPDVENGKWQVSSGGGTRPLWSRDGRELFFYDTRLGPAGASVMRVRVTPGVTWTATAPEQLLEGPFYMSANNPGRTYDISPDGRRFILVKADAGGAEATPPQVVIVENWIEELKRLVGE